MIRRRRPVIVWGSYGIGKSQLVHQTAAADARDVIELRAAQMDATDVLGLPTVTPDGRTQWAIPAWFPTDPAARSVIFLDELNRAPSLVQNALFQFIDQRRLGGAVLPPGCAIVAACNRETDGGGVVRMPAALAARFVHLEMDPDIQSWSEWAIREALRPELIAFLRFRPELLNKPQPLSRVSPTPRTWAFVHDIVEDGNDPDVELALVHGTVGHEAAIEFEAFLRLYRSLPNIDAILLNPTTAAVPPPDEVSTRYAVAAALAGRATDTNLGRVIAYMERVGTEYAVFTVKAAVGRDSSLGSTHDFTRFIDAHPDVV
jgi:hypothetical protein